MSQNRRFSMILTHVTKPPCRPWAGAAFSQAQSGPPPEDMSQSVCTRMSQSVCTRMSQFVCTAMSQSLGVQPGVSSCFLYLHLTGVPIRTGWSVALKSTRTRLYASIIQTLQAGLQVLPCQSFLSQKLKLKGGHTEK